MSKQKITKTSRILNEISEATDELPFGVYILDQNLQIRYVNKMFAQIAEMQENDLYENIEQFFNLIHTDDRQTFFKLNSDALNNRKEFSHEMRQSRQEE